MVLVVLQRVERAVLEVVVQEALVHLPMVSAEQPTLEAVAVVLIIKALRIKQVMAVLAS